MGAFKILMHILFFIKKMYFYHAEKKIQELTIL